MPGRAISILQAGVGGLGQLIEQLRQITTKALLSGHVYPCGEIALIGRLDQALDIGHDGFQRRYRGIHGIAGRTKHTRVVFLDTLRQIAHCQRLRHTHYVVQAGVRGISQLVERGTNVTTEALLAVERNARAEVAT